jgi:hypothetical protein
VRAGGPWGTASSRPLGCAHTTYRRSLSRCPAPVLAPAHTSAVTLMRPSASRRSSPGGCGCKSWCVLASHTRRQLLNTLHPPPPHKHTHSLREQYNTIYDCTFLQPPAAAAGAMQQQHEGWLLAAYHSGDVRCVHRMPLCHAAQRAALIPPPTRAPTPVHAGCSTGGRCAASGWRGAGSRRSS